MKLSFPGDRGGAAEISLHRVNGGDIEMNGSPGARLKITFGGER